MVASEALPFAKTGGLADVVGALPHALQRLGHHVDIVMPRYRGIEGEPLAKLPVALGGQVSEATLQVTKTGNVRVVLVDRPEYFQRDYLYGVADHDYPDNPERFAFLSQAALNLAMTADGRYDVTHAHDWQAGLVPVLAASMFRTGAAPRRVPTVF